jgi:site-specific recombinase XerD
MPEQLCYAETMFDLNAAVEAFLIARQFQYANVPRTIAWYAWSLDQFARYVAGRPIDRDLCRAFIADLVERRQSAYTIRNFTRVLQTFFRWCVDEERLIADPTDRLKIPKLPRRVPRGISPDDLRALLAAANIRDRAILLTLADSGVRVSELCGMRLDELDLVGGSVRVIGKGDQERFAFLSHPTCEAIQSWVRIRASTSPFLFVSEQDRPFQPNTVTQILRRLAKRAGVKGRCNAHSFRHAFAREFLTSGGDLASLSSILGHSDVRTTMIYAAFTTAELRAKHAAHSPVRTLDLRN